MPLLGGPLITAICGAWLFLAYGTPDDGFRSTLSPTDEIAADASAAGADLVPTGGTQAVAALVDTVAAKARDVTPPGVTPGPAVDGPLKRIAPPKIETLDRPKPTDVFRRIVVLDAGHFRVVRKGEAIVVSIAGIRTPAFDETCRDTAGVEWKCGAKARAELARLIGGRSLECSMVDTTDPRNPTAHCAVGPRDLAKWLVEMGWADPTHEDKVLSPLHAAAKDQRRGRFGPAPLGVIAG
ncbi:thermonuclease family protein [Chthonobacter albigriseus]|uniref:thermonuclease family protein n=1 Tax=Chthonobacter albigriseus TaxID=1683161 RepID=UPI0015EEA6D2|nr:thermonuclease family protein [Chthonobacter albigriseus]